MAWAEQPNAAAARPARATPRCAPRGANRPGPRPRPRGYLGSLYPPLLRRFGKKGEAKAAFAVGHAILVIAWHLLHDERDYQDLGADYLDRRKDNEARKRYLIRQLETLGHKVTIEPAA